MTQQSQISKVQEKFNQKKSSIAEKDKSQVYSLENSPYEKSLDSYCDLEQYPDNYDYKKQVQDSGSSQNKKKDSNEAFSTYDRLLCETTEMEVIKDLITSGETSEIRQNTSFISMQDNSSFQNSLFYNQSYKETSEGEGDTTYSPSNHYSNNTLNQKSFSNLSNWQITKNDTNNFEASNDSLYKMDNNQIQYIDYKSNAPNKFKLDITGLTTDSNKIKQRQSRYGQTSSRDPSSSRGLRSSRDMQMSYADQMSSRDQISSRNPQSSSYSQYSSNRNRLTKNNIAPLNIDDINGHRSTPSMQYEGLSDRYVAQKKKQTEEHQFEELFNQNRAEYVQPGALEVVEEKSVVVRDTQESLPISQMPDLSKVNVNSTAQSVNRNQENKIMTSNSIDVNRSMSLQSRLKPQLSPIEQTPKSAIRSSAVNLSTKNSSSSSMFSKQMASSQVAFQNTVNNGLNTGLSGHQLVNSIDDIDKHLTESYERQAGVSARPGRSTPSYLQMHNNGRAETVDKLSVMLDEMYSFSSSDCERTMQNRNRQNSGGEGELQNQVTRLSIYESKSNFNSILNQSLAEIQPYISHQEKQDSLTVVKGDTKHQGRQQNGFLQNGMLNDNNKCKESSISSLYKQSSVIQDLPSARSGQGVQFPKSKQKQLESIQVWQERIDLLQKKRQQLSEQRQQLSEQYRNITEDMQQRNSLSNRKEDDTSKASNDTSKAFGDQKIVGKRGNVKVPFKSSADSFSQSVKNNSRSMLFRKDEPSRYSQSKKVYQQNKSIEGRDAPPLSNQSPVAIKYPQSVQEEYQVLSEVLDKSKQQKIREKRQQKVGGLDLFKALPHQQDLWRQQSERAINDRRFNDRCSYNSSITKYQPQSMNPALFNDNHKYKDTAYRGDIERVFKNIQKANQLKNQARKIEEENFKALIQSQGFNPTDHKQLKQLLDLQLQQDVYNYQRKQKAYVLQQQDDHFELPSYSEKVNFTSV